MHRSSSCSSLRNGSITELKRVLFLFGLAACFSANSASFGSSLRTVETQDQLIEQFGNPIGFMEVGNRKILQYTDRNYWLEGNRIVRSRTRVDEVTASRGTTELIVMNPSVVEGPEGLGSLSIEDAYIRGGRFSHLNHESLNESVLSMSGVDAYVPVDSDEGALRAVQTRIRKVYLQFHLGVDVDAGMDRPAIAFAPHL